MPTMTEWSAVNDDEAEKLTGSAPNSLAMLPAQKSSENGDNRSTFGPPPVDLNPQSSETLCIIFRHTSKRIAFLESVNFSMCVYMQIFNFRGNVSDVTTVRHPSGAYISQIPGHRLSTLAKGTPSEISAFHQYHWFGVKLFPVGCAQDSRRVP